MRISETSVAPAPPEVVFDYTTDPANLASWRSRAAGSGPLYFVPYRQRDRLIGDCCYGLTN
jgi:hypothetical protein